MFHLLCHMLNTVDQFHNSLMSIEQPVRRPTSTLMSCLFSPRAKYVTCLSGLMSLVRKDRRLLDEFLLAKRHMDYWSGSSRVNEVQAVTVCVFG